MTLHTRSFVNPKSTHINKKLTNYAIAYAAQEFLMDKLLPVVQVDKQSDDYLFFPNTNSERRVDAKIGPTQEPGQVNRTATTKKYSVDLFGLSDRIPVSSQDNDDEPKMASQENCVSDLMGLLNVEREGRGAALITNPANYNVGNRLALTTGNGWSNDSIDPMLAMIDARAAVRRGPNTVLRAVMGSDSWRMLRKNAKMLARTNGGATKQNAADVTKAMVAELLEVDEVLVGDSYQVLSNPGSATQASTRIWGDGFAILACHTAPSTKSLHFGSTFRLYSHEVYAEVERKRGSKGVWFCKITYEEDIRAVAGDAGFLITNLSGA